MTAYRRAALSLVLGATAVAGPAAAWAVIVATQLSNPQAFHDQGGMFISLILFPFAVLVALACGVPAIILGAVSPGTDGPGWRLLGAALSVVGMLLALGTCVGPQVLAGAIR
jgi:hypothetical protein